MISYMKDFCPVAKNWKRYGIRYEEVHLLIKVFSESVPLLEAVG